MRGNSFASAGSGSRIGIARKLRNPAICLKRQLNVSRETFLNEMSFDEIRAPKLEFHDPAEQGTSALAHPCARRSVAGRLAARLAPPVRPRAGLRARKSD